jgi:ubiquinol-cytochrome c reductase cytochrome c subunit
VSGRARTAGAAVAGVAALTGLGVAVAPAPSASAPSQLQRGAALYKDACSSCHGEHLEGVRGRGPKLRGVGARSADFYLSTGRMPLDAPGDEPVRTPPSYGRAGRAALVAYIGSFGGPGVPVPRGGSLAEGRELFSDACAGCHQIAGRGGIVPPQGVAPPLQEASPREIAEAVRIGPYTMPRFARSQFDEREVASLVRYVRSTRNPPDRGGWGIGNLGPVPEGMVAWLIAGVALVAVIRVLGERTT